MEMDQSLTRSYNKDKDRDFSFKLSSSWELMFTKQLWIIPYASASGPHSSKRTVNDPKLMELCWH